MRWIPLKRSKDPRGILAALETPENCPFVIKRVFTISSVPNREIVRGNHAHKAEEQIIACISGTFRGKIHDGKTWIENLFFNTKEPAGLYVPPFHWVCLDGFQRNSVCIVLCSTVYDAKDYVSDFEEFCRLAGQVQ